MTAGVYTPRGTSTSATLPQGVYHVKCYESSGTSVRFLSVYSSAGCQLGQQEVPGGGAQGDRKGGRGATVGTNDPATAHAGELLLMPDAVDDVVKGPVPEGLRRQQALLGGSVQQALRQRPSRAGWAG
jgi:hypothetical protein